MMPGSVDTHAHIFDPARFPYPANATYRPSGQEVGPVERYLDVLDAHGISNAVIVQPTSGYRFHNAVTLDAITRAQGRLRGVLRIDPATAGEHEAVLDHPFVAGVRFDLMGDGVDALAHAGNRWLLQALKARGKTAVIQAEGEQLAEVLPLLVASGTALCIDHCGRPEPRQGLAQRGFQALLELGRQGHAVKLSGPFRFSHAGPPFDDVLPYVLALLETFTPARCCWGSDWPYLRVEERMDYGPELALIKAWLPNTADLRAVLVTTPRRVFGFPAH